MHLSPLSAKLYLNREKNARLSVAVCWLGVVSHSLKTVCFIYVMKRKFERLNECEQIISNRVGESQGPKESREMTTNFEFRAKNVEL